MPRASETVKCVDCGKEFLRKNLNRKFRCQNCAYNKVRAVIRQMFNKSGPEYEHWKEACLRKAERYAKGIKGGKT